MNNFIKNIIKKIIKNYRLLKIKITYSNKIKRILKKCNNYNNLEKSYKEQINEYWDRYKIKINSDWHNWYSEKSGIKSVRYIPEDIFYCNIVPYYNRLDFKEAYADKAFYSILFPNIKRPITLFKNIAGCYYDDDFNIISRENAIKKCINKKLIIKPSIDSGGGRGIYFIEPKSYDEMKNEIDKIMNQFDSNYIVQEVLQQHKSLGCMNPQSVNTIRVMSFMYNQKVNILSSVLRMGVNGSKVDNTSTGGISCGIMSNGKLKKYAYDIYGNKFDTHPQGYKFEDNKVPSYKEIIDIINNEHLKFPHFKLISWDFAVDEKGTPILIEYNLGYQGINLHQLNNGPLFSDLTDKVLKEILL